MKDFLMSPVVLKLLGTAMAVGIYVLAHKMPDLKEVLLPLAGGVVGGVLMPRPGDAVKVKDSV